MTKSPNDAFLRMYPHRYVTHDCRLGYPGYMVLFPIKARDSSLVQSIQTKSGVHSVSYSIDTTGTFPRGTVVGEWT